MEIMMKNVVLVFSPTNEDTLQAGRVSYGHTVQSVAARSIVHKFIKSSSAWTKPEIVLMDLLWALSLASVSERFNSTRKLKTKKKRKRHPWKLSITIEKEYIPLLNSNCQRLPRCCSGQRRELLVLTDSEGPGSNPLEAYFS